MKDIWYADNRDLAKWAILCHLADSFKVATILQVAFYRISKFDQIVIDGHKRDLPPEVTAYFRNINNICGIKSKVQIEVFDLLFEDRQTYLQAVVKWLSGHQKEKLIIFLDPDTGLQPMRTKPNNEHILETELKDIWTGLKHEDVFVLYQHKTNRRGEGWVEPKKKQFAKAIEVPTNMVKIAHGFEVASDIVLFYTQK